MYIIEVIPLTILPPNVPQLLSYFFNKKLEKGAIVEISFGNRKVRAAVVASTPIEDRKISLKKSGFQLKQLLSVINEFPQISNNQFKIALWISRHYYAPLGYCLKTVLPPFFMKKGYETFEQGSSLRVLTRMTPIKKPLFLLSRAKDMLENLLPFIRKTTRIRGQVAFIVSDISTINYFYKVLSGEFKVIKIHSGLNNKKFYESWKNIKSNQADIILGTRQSLFMPFKNLELVIVDDVLHEFYKSDMTPKYNTPDLARAIADFNNAHIIFVSAVSGVENYYRLKNKEYELLDETEPRSQIKIVNMVREIKNGNFSLFSQELKDQFLSAINPNNQNKKILIFSPRRGYSGVLVCQNCSYVVKCKDCGIAFRVHKTTDLVLVCHHCSRRIKMPENCPNCKSFKFKTAGPAGTQKIYDEIQKLITVNNLDKIPVQILDTDVIKNETEEEDTTNEIQKPHTSILIATQMIFSHRYDIKFDLIGVLNTDSLISAPDFRAEERLFYQIEKLLDFQPKNIFLQTYNPESQAIIVAGQGNYKEFCEKELEIRKVFSYPPYSQLIKLTFGHKDRNKASHEARILSEKLKMAIGQLGLSQKVKLIDSHPSFVEKKRGLFVYNTILKISPEVKNLKDILKFVPSNWFVDVDPRSII